MSFIDWLKGEGNPKLPKSEYLYGTRHLIVIAIAIGLSVLFSILLHNKSEKTKKIFFKICAIIALTVEILQRVIKLIFMEIYTVESVAKTILPLYFCSIAVCFTIVALLTDKKALINASAIMGILVTTAYLVYPFAGMERANLTFDVLYSISSHAFGFIVYSTLITTRYAKFEFKDIFKTIIIFAVFVGYGLIMSLYVFPGTDYVFALENPLGFESIIPYPVIYGLFLLFFILIFYIVEFLCKKVKTKR